LRQINNNLFLVKLILKKQLVFILNTVTILISLIKTLMFYELFLNYIRDLYIKENSGTITWEEIKESPMWLYMISCFSEHTV
jgi:hypothetical protein